MMLRVDNVDAMKAQKLLIGVAVQAAGSGIGFDNEAIHVSDDQPISGGFKDAAILGFLLTQLLLGLQLLGDITYYGQKMRSSLVGERGYMCLSMKRGSIFAF